MPRLPSYRLHKGSGQGVTTIGGKDFYFGPYRDSESKRKFERLLAEYLASRGSATFRVDHKFISMAELAVEYLKFARDYYSDSEYEGSRSALKPICDLYADTLTKDFDSVAFRACRQWWIESGASRRYVNKQAKRLLRILKWGVSEKKFPNDQYQVCKCVDPLKRGRCQAPEAPEVKPVSDEAVEATLPCLTRVVADMVRFQRLVGCRPSEVCSIKPSMIDRSSAVWDIHYSEHKTAWRGKSRTVYVGPQAQKILEPYLDRREDHFCFDPRESEALRLKVKHQSRVTPMNQGNKPGTNVRVRPKKKIGNCFTTATYGRSIKYACLKAFPAPKGLPDDEVKKWNSDHSWAPNQLRHAKATELRAKYGIEEASLILGHSGLEVTQLYAEKDRSKARSIAMEAG